MTDIPEWDPDTFKPTHTTYANTRVQTIDSAGDYVNTRYADGLVYPSLRITLTPISEPVTAREQWGYIDVEGDFWPTSTRLIAERFVAVSPRRALAQLKAIDGQLVVCDEHGTPVQVQP